MLKNKTTLWLQHKAPPKYKAIISELQQELNKTRDDLETLRMLVNEKNQTIQQLIQQIKYLSSKK